MLMEESNNLEAETEGDCKAKQEVETVTVWW